MDIELQPARAKMAVYTPVRNLMLYVTEDCNLRCDYCFVNKQPKRMTVETARKAVDFFVHRNISGTEYTPNITFFGGEPFTELDVIEEVIACARKLRPTSHKLVRFSATTNGTIANERVERIIRNSRMSLLVSMDGGHGASQYRPFVSGRSSYESLARNLPRLASWSHDVMVRLTFHPRSLDLVDNVRHVLELGAPKIALCPVIDNAEWRGREAELDTAYQSLAAWYIEEARNGRILPLEVTNTLIRQFHAYRHTGQRPQRPCGVGTAMIGVDTEGNVMPCHRFLYRRSERLGTVDTPRFDERRDKYVHLSSNDFLECEKCHAKAVCGGGCRAVALNAGLALNQPHPSYCLTTRAHAKAVQTIYDMLTTEGNLAFARLLRTSSVPVGAIEELAFR